jgi:hypothetical protein
MSPGTLLRRYAATPLVAWHEAGHALVTHRRGRRVEQVQASYARDSGETRIHPIYDPLDRALVLLAGERAERRSVSWEPDFEELNGSADDRRGLVLALEELPLWSLDELVDKVDDMLRWDQAAPERLARRLDEKVTMSGAEAVAILDG